MSEFNTEIREGKVRAELSTTAKLFEEGNCELALIQHTFEIYIQLHLAPDGYELKKEMTDTSFTMYQSQFN